MRIAGQLIKMEGTELHYGQGRKSKKREVYRPYTRNTMKVQEWLLWGGGGGLFICCPYSASHKTRSLAHHTVITYCESVSSINVIPENQAVFSNLFDWIDP